MKNEKFRTKDYVIGALLAVNLFQLTLLTHSEENCVSNSENPVTEDLLENNLVIKSSEITNRNFDNETDPNIFKRLLIFEAEKFRLDMDGAKVILFHNDDMIREFETKKVYQTNEECEKCSSEKKSETEQTDENFSYKKRLQKLLIDDWSQGKLPQPKKIDLEPSSKIDFEILECESNPELNPYIKKPKFSRDTANYDVSREGYTPKELVCPETSTLKIHNLPVYKLEDCEKPVDPKSVLTIIVDDEKMKKIFLERSLYEVKIKSEIEDLETEYIFLADNHFDFISLEANLERMIREAEFQNADIVAGAWVDQNGHWSNSCLQFDVKPYQLDIKDGYYKSIRSAMYCDGSLGPLLDSNVGFSKRRDFDQRRIFKNRLFSPE